MSRRPLNPARIVALVELTRRPTPPTYDLTPKNRQQRRCLARELKRRRKAVNP